MIGGYKKVFPLLVPEEKYIEEKEKVKIEQQIKAIKLRNECLKETRKIKL